MKNQLLFFLSILILSSCSVINREALPYKTSEKILTSTLVTFQLIDAYQTDILTHHKDFKEANSGLVHLFGEQIAWYEISAVKAAIMLPVYYFYVHKAKSHKARKGALWLLNTISIIPVISNSIVGGEVLFKF